MAIEEVHTTVVVTVTRTTSYTPSRADEPVPTRKVDEEIRFTVRDGSTDRALDRTITRLTAFTA